jgi:hypothetical protein
MDQRRQNTKVIPTDTSMPADTRLNYLIFPPYGVLCNWGWAWNGQIRVEMTMYSTIFGSTSAEHQSIPVGHTYASGHTVRQFTIPLYGLLCNWNWASQRATGTGEIWVVMTIYSTILGSTSAKYYSIPDGHSFASGPTVTLCMTQIFINLFLDYFSF